MHPDEETLGALLAGRLAEAARAEAHLRDCPDCARAASRMRALGFLMGVGEARQEAASAGTLAAMRAACREALPATPSWRRRAPAWTAAAGLLLVAGLFLRGREPAPERPAASPPAAVEIPSRLEAGAGPRLLSPRPGSEILLAPGTLLERRKPSGGWALARGACLAFASPGEPLRLEAGPLILQVSDGEVLVRRRFASPPAPPPPGSAWLLREARAEAPETTPSSVEVVVLSGLAEVLAPSGRVALFEGEGGVWGSGEPIRRRWTGTERAILRAGLIGTGEGSAPGRALGSVAQDGKGKALALNGREGLAAWMAREEPQEPYLLQVRLRLPEKPATLGISFLVGGSPTLWVPEAPGLFDGSWHALEARVSAAWVVLGVDGVVSHRVPRVGFRLNPAPGVTGTGPAVWGGRAEISAFVLQSLR